MNARDAWIYARLLCGVAGDDEHKDVSETFRPFANQLAGMPKDERQRAWTAFHSGRSDADELTKAVADADPLGPPPKGDDGDGDGWEPIRLQAMPPAAPFPLDVLPDDAARLVKEGAASIGCPRDFIAVSMLAAAGGTIGRSVSLHLKPNFFAGSSLYVVCVGPPSNGKTPAFKLAVDGVRRISSTLADEHEQRMKQWEEESEKEEPSKGRKKRSKPTPKPKPRRIDVDDITMEALAMRLGENRRGLIMARDELSAFLLGMNQYKGGKGSDRSVILKIWSGDAITRDRVLDESGPSYCRHPCMSILGGLPPDMLGSLHDDKGSADGFVDRFLFAYPEPIQIPNWSERGIPENLTDRWCEITDRLWQRPMRHHENRAVPHVARFTPEGKDAWKARYDAHAAEMSAPGFPPSMTGPWGKLKEYAGRFALILACLDHAADPSVDPEAVPDVRPEVVENAWRLVDYFKSHARRAHVAIRRGTGIGGSETVQVLMKWLREARPTSFTERDIKQARRTIDHDDLDEALTYLTDRNVIRLKEASTEPRKRGRPSTAYDVNPALLVTQNTQEYPDATTTDDF